MNKKLMVGALVAGLIAGQTVLAQEGGAAAAAPADKPAAEKASCKGKAGCKGKEGKEHKAKKDKKAKKDEATK